MQEDDVKELLQDEEFQRLPDVVNLGSDAVPVLTDVLTSDPDPLMRQRAAIALGRMDAPAAGDALEAALNDASAPVAIAAIDAVMLLDHRPAIGNLRRLAKHEDVSVRGHAVKAIGTLGDEDDEALLHELVTNDRSDMVRDAASRAVRNLLGQP
jgi:HEAT repeat protein